MLVLRRNPGESFLCLQMTRISLDDVYPDSVVLSRQDLSSSEPHRVRLKLGESVIWDGITFKILLVEGRRVQFGITAPSGIQILRTEVGESGMMRLLHTLLSRIFQASSHS